MTERKFAEMTRDELKKYCEELEKELAKARWFLQNRIQQEQENN